MALKTTPTTGTLDGLSFGTGADASGWSLVVNQWDGWDDPSPAPADHEDKPNASGAFRGPNFRKSKPMQLICTGHSESVLTRSELIRKIAAICGDPDTLYPLTRAEPGLSLTIWVELDGMIKINRRPDGKHVVVTIPLKAADGQKYSPDNPASTTGLASPPGDGILWNGTPGNTGIEWNGTGIAGAAITGLVWQSSPGSPGVMRLINLGTRSAPIRFTFSATVTDPQIDCVQTGQRIKWIGTVSGQSLLVDTKTMRATIDGVNVSPLLVNSDRIVVPPNSSIDIAYSAASGSGTQLTGVNANVYA